MHKYVKIVFFSRILNNLHVTHKKRRPNASFFVSNNFAERVLKPVRNKILLLDKLDQSSVNTQKIHSLHQV